MKMRCIKCGYRASPMMMHLHGYFGWAWWDLTRIFRKGGADDCRRRFFHQRWSP